MKCSCLLKGYYISYVDIGYIVCNDTVQSSVFNYQPMKQMIWIFYFRYHSMWLRFKWFIRLG